jgi:hypothetical protein
MYQMLYYKFDFIFHCISKSYVSSLMAKSQLKLSAPSEKKISIVCINLNSIEITEVLLLGT